MTEIGAIKVDTLTVGHPVDLELDLVESSVTNLATGTQLFPKSIVSRRVIWI